MKMAKDTPEFSITPDGAVIQWELKGGLYLVQAIGKQTIYEIAEQLRSQDRANKDLQRSVDLVRSADLPRHLRTLEN
jgi:hypothetical protein